MQTYIKLTLHFPGKSLKDSIFQEKILFFSENDDLLSLMETFFHVTLSRFPEKTNETSLATIFSWRNHNSLQRSVSDVGPCSVSHNKYLHNSALFL